jgi:hypothetical protein
MPKHNDTQVHSHIQPQNMNMGYKRQVDKIGSEATKEKFNDGTIV